jgi:hypothetical protein
VQKDEPCTVHVGKRERNFHLEIEGSLVFCSLATQRTLLTRNSLLGKKILLSLSDRNWNWISPLADRIFAE